MVFTDRSDLFGSVHEDGINRVLRHFMRQRPSLFNYATPIFHERPELFCEKIEPAQAVLEAGNPLFTEQKPLPILGTSVDAGLNFCIQFTDIEIDFHPGNVISLPRELGRLPEQRFALRMRACAGLDCPSEEVIQELLPIIERDILAKQQTSTTKRDKEKARARFQQLAPDQGVFFDPERNREPKISVLPTSKLICFCLELFAVGHFEWDSVAGSSDLWLKPRLDGIEIVDLRPTPMEDVIECYITTVLRLGILPNLMTPMEKMVLDITALLRQRGLELGEQVTLGPAEVPADVPNNPAIEDDQLIAFIKLTITENEA